MNIPLVTEIGQNKPRLIENGEDLVYPNGDILVSKYKQLYFDDFLYQGSPFGILPDLILEEPEAGEILFGAQSFLSINLFNSESINKGSIKKVTGNPLNHKISCSFRHSANDANMRDMLFGYEALTFFPTLETRRIAITGTLVGTDYTLSVDIGGGTGRWTQTLGIVTNTRNTLSIEFTDSDLIFTLNETSITIASDFGYLPVFFLPYPALEFRVSSYSTIPVTNRVDLDYLKVEKNG